VQTEVTVRRVVGCLALRRLTAGINDLIHRNYWLKRLPAVVCLGCIFYIIGSNKREIRTAVASGVGSASRDGLAMICKHGVSNDAPQMTDGLKIGKSYQELESGFLYGYIIMGRQGKQVTYELHLKHIRISADWDDAVLSFSTEGNWGYVYIPRLEIINPESHTGFDPIDSGEYFPLEYREPYRWNLSAKPGVPCAFVKVLDQENKLLLVGFNPGK
jgi:hypothetical protein